VPNFKFRSNDVACELLVFRISTMIGITGIGKHRGKSEFCAAIDDQNLQGELPVYMEKGDQKNNFLCCILYIELVSKTHVPKCLIIPAS
jgi:hypothetical protein